MSKSHRDDKPGASAIEASLDLVFAELLASESLSPEGLGSDPALHAEQALTRLHGFMGQAGGVREDGVLSLESLSDALTQGGLDDEDVEWILGQVCAMQENLTPV